MSINILLVDSTPLINSIIKALRCVFGEKSNIIRTSSLAETKEYEDEEFDLIITELELPDKKGCTILNVLSLLFKETPIIATSSHENDDLVRGSIRHGAVCFINKQNESENIIRQKLLAIWERHMMNNHQNTLQTVMSKFSAIQNQLEEQVNDGKPQSIAN